MSTNNPEEFPRREFSQSKLPYQVAVYGMSVVLPMPIVRFVGVTFLPIWSGSLVILLITWCVAGAGCFVLLRKLLSMMDFDKPFVTIGPDAVTFLHIRPILLPWSAITKVKFHQSGRSGISLIFHMEDSRQETVGLHQLAGISGRQLFETIRGYHRKFGPRPAPIGPGYDSSTWTGLDDD